MVVESCKVLKVLIQSSILSFHTFESSFMTLTCFFILFTCTNISWSQSGGSFLVFPIILLMILGNISFGMLDIFISIMMKPWLSGSDHVSLDFGKLIQAFCIAEYTF